MRFSTLPLLAGLFLGDLCHVAATDTCTAAEATSCNCATTPTKRYQARAYTFPENLFPRTGETCPNGDPSCCSQYGPGPLQVSADTTTADLQCGTNFGDDSQDVTSGVKYTIENCPGSTTDQCLHIAITPAAGVTVSDIHLQVDDVPITLNTGLGKWPFNEYCTENPTECWVPTSAILATFSTPPTSLCGSTIYVAVGISINGATCFNRGTTIGSGNWFMYVTLKLECPEVCLHRCCCPDTPPPLNTCLLGTAFGYGDNFKNLNGNPVGPRICKAERWGWYFTPNKATLTAGISGTLIVGAGGNDVSKGIPVGTWSAKLVGSNLWFEYSLYDSDSQGHFDLAEVHVYAACAPPGENKCGPGQYTFKDEGLSGSSDTYYPKSFAVQSPCTSTSTYYLIFHAAINKKTTETCPSPVV